MTTRHTDLVPVVTLQTSRDIAPHRIDVAAPAGVARAANRRSGRIPFPGDGPERSTWQRSPPSELDDRRVTSDLANSQVASFKAALVETLLSEWEVSRGQIRQTAFDAFTVWHTKIQRSPPVLVRLPVPLPRSARNFPGRMWVKPWASAP